MEFAPAWMSYTNKENSSQGTRFLGKERERGVPKYGRQLSFSHMPTHSSSSFSSSSSSTFPSSSSPYSSSSSSTLSSLSLEPGSALPFACAVASPPAPASSHAPASILGEPQPRVLNRSKSSPGFGSPKSGKQKKPIANFNKPKPKPPKPPLSPSSYMKSHSQPNLFNNEKANNWHQAHKAQQSSSLSFSSTSASASPSPSSVPTSPTAISTPVLTTTTSVSSIQPSAVPPSTSPPLPPSSSPPPVLVPEIDKLKTLIPATGSTPKAMKPRVMVGPPLPLAKKAPASIPNNSNITNSNSSNNNTSTSINSSAPNPATAPAPNGLTAYFRKTHSEPTLMHHKAAIQDAALATRKSPAAMAQDAATAVRRAEALAKKVRNLESEKAQAQLLKEAVASKQPKRSNFFQHVIKQEEQGTAITEDDSPIGIDGAAEPFSPATSPPLSSATPLSASTSSSSSSLSSATFSPPPPSGIRSPLPEDMEDEERFLRTLGWVPDEEDPVPVLDEDEIRDVRVKIFLSRGTKNQEDEDDEDEDEDEERGRSVEIGVDVK